MKLPGKTSKLLDLQSAVEDELNARFARIFKRHRGLAFVSRHDMLFTEHWTPERAAAGYTYSGHEVHNGEVVLYGTENANGFHYRISISFPLDLADKSAEIDAYLKRRYTEARKAESENVLSAEHAREAVE
ncbi:MAG TPA: hypothetical protein VFL42_06795 [Terriglobales bacterium]|jgi:hypothetical protein|nr:hypothetical protein [Terriglobales bacterium]